jgi:FkbM family methyltransferase
MTYSQFNIDIYLCNLFEKLEKGFFIEAGANDGVSQNNTFLLEKKLNWNGLLIEPNIHAFNSCKKNRNCIVENYALVSFDYKEDYILGDFEQINFEKSMMGGCSEIHEKRTKVKAIQLSKLLDNLSISKINFLSIDVEGYELEALSGIDYQKHAPEYILYEDHEHRNVKYAKNPQEFFENKNYENIEKFSNNHYLYKLKR